MYEIEEHQKNLQLIADGLTKIVEAREVEGVLVIAVKKNNEIEVETVFGRVSSFEWRGLLDYARDVVKGDVR